MTEIFPSRLSRIKLSQFRNYQSIDLAFKPLPVVFAGSNGAGKTNLLEAISYLSPGRGLRRAPYGDVALSAGKGGSGTWAVAVELDTIMGETEIGTGLAPLKPGQAAGGERGRQVKIDHDAVRSSDALLEYVRVIWVTPAMDGLFTSAAGDRRRFLDRMVLAIDTEHGRRVSAFDKAVRSRNKLLEQSPGNGAWLDAIEAQVAELGIAISAARSELISLVHNEARYTIESADSAFPQSTLALEGSIDDLLQNQAAVDSEDVYRNMLREARARDARAGRTLDGPHRSDMIVHHAPKNMPAKLCSTGEQKALLIGLVLAHARLVSRLSRMTPLVLLDEVTAHLDADRRAALFAILENLNCQAFMTGTDLALFDALDTRAHRFHVDDGSVQAL